MQFNDGKIWEPKIGEVGDITNHIKPVIFGITESKVDSSVSNAEVNVNGHSMVRNDRNRNCESDAFFIRNNLCCNTRNIFSNSFEHVFFKTYVEWFFG